MENKFNELYNYRNAFKTITILTVVIVIGCLFAVGGMFYVFTTNQTNSTLQIWVKTQDGSMFKADKSTEITLEDRVIEYKHHVKWFYNIWYTLNRTDYQENVNTGLNLINKKSGEDLLDVYVSQGVFQKIDQTGRGLISKIIEDPIIEVTENGVFGKIIGELKFIDENGKEYRKQHLDISFQLQDVLKIQGRSDKNPHGVMISEWKIVNDNVIDSTN